MHRSSFLQWTWLLRTTWPTSLDFTHTGQQAIITQQPCPRTSLARVRPLWQSQINKSRPFWKMQLITTMVNTEPLNNRLPLA